MILKDYNYALHTLKPSPEPSLEQTVLPSPKPTSLRHHPKHHQKKHYIGYRHQIIIAPQKSPQKRP